MEKKMSPAAPDGVDSSKLSTFEMAGGELGVENVNAVQNQTVRVNVNNNASISAFAPGGLSKYLMFPTVLFNGTITSTAPVGSDIYLSEVSPTLLKSTSLTRIKNFATNFRQWNGSFCLRIIFTKPIFVQTKVIGAFIPGLSLTDAADLTVGDLYGAQYHSVMNPDNDNELSFFVPFISGLNWLNMDQSTGVVAFKLFQPLIASQPTGVANVSIPYTILLSSQAHEAMPPLAFRFLVAPSFDNPVAQNQAIRSLVNSISPSSSPTAVTPGFVAPGLSANDSVRSVVVLPLTARNEFTRQNYVYNLDGTAAIPFGSLSDNITTASLSGSLHGYGASGSSYIAPFSQLNQFGTFEKAPNHLPASNYDEVLTKLLQVNDYTYATGPNNGFRFKFNANVCESGVGDFVTNPFSFKNSSSVGYIIGTSNMVITRGIGGGYNYFIETTYSGTPGSYADPIIFKDSSPLTYYAPSTADLTSSLRDAALAVGGDSVPAGATHFIAFSKFSASETQYQMENGNYSNLIPCTSDQLSACLNQRSVNGYRIVDSESSTDTRSLLSFLFFIKTAADVIGTVAQVVSNVLSYLLPVTTINGTTIGTNSFVVLPIDANNPVFYDVATTFAAPGGSVVNRKIKTGLIKQ